jgi:CheY-like chemotaxis protein
MTAADGAAARQACHRFLPDLVITDLELPKLHGLALIARLHEVGADVGIIAMSGSDRAFEGRKGTRRLCRAPQADRDDRFRGGSPFDAAGVGWPLAVRPKRGKLQAHTLETPGRSFGGAKVITRSASATSGRPTAARGTGVLPRNAVLKRSIRQSAPWHGR